MAAVVSVGCSTGGTWAAPGTTTSRAAGMAAAIGARRAGGRERVVLAHNDEVGRPGERCGKSAVLSGRSRMAARAPTIPATGCADMMRAPARPSRARAPAGRDKTLGSIVSAIGRRRRFPERRRRRVPRPPPLGPVGFGPGVDQNQRPLRGPASRAQELERSRSRPWRGRTGPLVHAQRVEQRRKIICIVAML